MPIYTFECTDCEAKEEHLVALKERDRESFLCSECGEPMKRLIDAPTLGKPAYQMGAVMGNGERVAGHFGKFAKKK